VFEDEADTISVDVGSDTMQAMLACPAAPSVSPSDTIPLQVIDFDDTLVRRLATASGDEHTDVLLRSARPQTNSDWPPAPKPPGDRQNRRAGMYKAITKVSSLIKIK
jgi:hypothetical protein